MQGEYYITAEVGEKEVSKVGPKIRWTDPSEVKLILFQSI